jgi:tetratricopeptide (TPR) repeat protein
LPPDCLPQRIKLAAGDFLRKAQGGLRKKCRQFPGDFMFSAVIGFGRSRFCCLPGTSAGRRTYLTEFRQAGAMRHVGWIVVAAIPWLLAGAAEAQTRDKDWAQCTGSTDDDNQIIASCTAIIQSRSETDENRSTAFNNRCMAVNNTGNHDRAIQDCDQAISLNPGNPDAYLSRAHALFNKADYDRAIADYDQAIALGSKSANTYVARGAAYHKKGDNARAIEDLDLAIKLDPDDAIAFFARGAAYQAESENARAIEDYSQAIKLAPRFAAAIYLRGSVKKIMGDDKGGDADIAQARQIDRAVGMTALPRPKSRR